MADEHSQMENRAEVIFNSTNAGNSTKCDLCKSLELQLSHVLNELSSLRLLVELLSKEYNHVQSELSYDAPMNINSGLRYHIIIRKHLTIKKNLKTTDTVPPQHIPETANRFEMLNNLSSDKVNHKSENKPL